jgi:signal transduction histidine kinase/CheY-like chemotaxis protein
MRAMFPPLRPRFTRITHRILVVFALVVGLCISASGFLVVQVSQGILTRKIAEGDLSLARRLAQVVDLAIGAADPALAILAQRIGEEFPDKVKLKSALEQAQAELPELMGAYVADSDGRLLACMGPVPSGDLMQLWPFQVALAGQRLLSEVYVDAETRMPLRSVALPISRGGRVLGVLSASLGFGKVSLPASGSVGTGADILVASGNGRVVAHTRLGELRDLDVSGLPVVEAALAGQEGSLSGYPDEFGREVLGSYAPIKDLGWGVVIQRPLSQLSGEVRALRLAVFYGIAASVLFAIGVGYLMARRLGRPIRELAVAAVKIGEGDLSATVEVVSADEIGALAASFNRMVSSLAKSREELTRWNEELEGIVDERTAELEEKGRELARSNEGLQELSRLKSEFLANMSHEIRTPMNAVIGFADLALKAGLDPRQRDYVSKIHDAGISLLGVVNDILDFSKIEAGKLKMDSLDFSIDAVIESVISIAGQGAYAKGIEPLLGVDPAVPRELRGDPQRLRQILVNLMGNAVKFTDSGEIELKVTLAERVGEKAKLLFSVRDTGIGMNEEQVSRLFQPFSQADGSTTRKYGGTGLGLSICARLVEMMSGQIWARSAVGEGSAFTFTAWFGLAENATLERSAFPPSLVGMRVLVADDNGLARESLRVLLESLRFRPETVASGEEAVEAARRSAPLDPFGLALIDWRMGGIDGIEATRRILAEAPEGRAPRIFVMSASGGGEGERELSLAAGAAGFFVKPVTGSSLFDMIVGAFAPEFLRGGRAGPPDARGPRGLEGARVLLAEDNEMNRQIAVELLRSAGAVTTAVVTGREAVDALAAEGEDFDLVLMDIQMPEMDGYEATRVIKAQERFSSLPVIAMTAHALADAQVMAKEAGMIDYIIKPIDPEAMFDTLRRHFMPAAGAAASTGPAARIAEGVDGPSIPLMAGIDVEDGLKRVVGNRKLYLDLLERYVEGQGKAADRLREALASGDRPLAERLAHTLKGVSGNIGAVAIQNTAAELEAAIVGGLPLSSFEGMLEGLSRALDEALGGIAPVVAAAKDRSEKGLPAASLSTVLETLTCLAEESDGEAVDYLASVRAELAAACPREDFERLEASIRAYDFPVALAVLGRLTADALAAGDRAGGKHV